MNKVTEQRLRKKVREILENTINEGDGDRQIAAQIKNLCAKYIATGGYQMFKQNLLTLVKKLS